MAGTGRHFLAVDAFPPAPEVPDFLAAAPDPPPEPLALPDPLEDPSLEGVALVDAGESPPDPDPPPLSEPDVDAVVGAGVVESAPPDLEPLPDRLSVL
jgi:hypothetical protein